VRNGYVFSWLRKYFLVEFFFPKKLKQNIIEENPFDIRPPGITTATWVKPILVAEIEFIEWT